MKSKTLSLLMAAVLGVSVLAGCGTESDDKKNGEGGKGDENTLTVWAWDSQFNLYAMEEAQKIYQKDHPDFKLNLIEVTWDDMQTKLGTIVGSGDYSQLPDI